MLKVVRFKRMSSPRFLQSMTRSRVIATHLPWAQRPEQGDASKAIGAPLASSIGCVTLARSGFGAVANLAAPRRSKQRLAHFEMANRKAPAREIPADGGGLGGAHPFEGQRGILRKHFDRVAEHGRVSER